MDCSFSAPSPLLDQSDELKPPIRSPSRLDFCMEDLGDGDDSPSRRMDWFCTCLGDDRPYTPAEKNSSVVGIAPVDPLGILDVVDRKEDPPRDTDPYTHESMDKPPELTDQLVVEPQAPIPVRPPSVQIQVDAQESMPPSRTAAQRLNYPHHGFSRSALLQQKSFWNSRHEEWTEWQSRMQQSETQEQEFEANDAYTGLAMASPRAAMSCPPYMRTPPSGLERDVADRPSRKDEQDVNASIYPRIGDISALRDPYSALYAFDMQRRFALLAPSASLYNAALVQPSMSLSLSSSSSSTLADDSESDSTLVADNSPVTRDQRPPEPSRCPSSPHNLCSWNSFCAWELSWYARWELLISIFQHNHPKYDALDTPMKLAKSLGSKAGSLSPKKIFRFTAGELDDEDSDEDEDYGMILVDSSFSVDFNEECERALAFYSRELKCSELTS